MPKNLFIDTNIFLDHLLGRGDGSASEILLLAETKDAKLFTTASIICTVTFHVQKLSGSLAKSKEIINNILSLVTIIEMPESVFHKGLSSAFKDLEDSFIYHAALGNGSIDYFITENIKDFKSASKQLPVITAKKFMTEINKD